MAIVATTHANIRDMRRSPARAGQKDRECYESGGGRMRQFNRRPRRGIVPTSKSLPNRPDAVVFDSSEEATRLRAGNERARTHDPTLGGFGVLETNGPDGLVPDDAARRHYFGEDVA